MDFKPLPPVKRRPDVATTRRPLPQLEVPDECVWRRRAGGVGASTSRWAEVVVAADGAAACESFEAFVRAYGGLERLWADRPDLWRIHGTKARLRRFTMRSATTEPPSFAPGFLRELPRLADAPPGPDEVVPCFVWSESGWRYEPDAALSAASRRGVPTG